MVSESVPSRVLEGICTVLESLRFMGCNNFAMRKATVLVSAINVRETVLARSRDPPSIRCIMHSGFRFKVFCKALPGRIAQ